ncbi:hypothetical protein EV368DRAFT_69945 [Lentinula lateritia]|nr:hypothetical protein EV368DRAFT_69945 [Lentinula lateritia]
MGYYAACRESLWRTIRLPATATSDYIVCTTFLALSLIEEGYTVFTNHEASGAASRRIADEANARMRQAGVHVLSMFAIACDLMRNWTYTPGALQMLPFFDRYFSGYGYLTRGHDAAIESGQILPGESQ